MNHISLIPSFFRVRLLGVALFLAVTGGVCLTQLTGCSTPPSARVVHVQTLKSVGQTAETAVVLSAQLYRDGKITAAQANEIAAFYDYRFQPAFRLAVSAVNANLDAIASPDVLDLAAQLSNLVLLYKNHP